MKKLSALFFVFCLHIYAGIIINPGSGGNSISTTLTSGHILVGSAANVATDVAMSGEASISNTGAVTLTNSAVIGKVLTGYVSGAGTVAATDTILQAIQKLNGNDATRLASLSAIGSSPNANAATITGSVLNLEPASGSFGGVVTTGTQTIAGAKTMSGALSISGTAGTIFTVTGSNSNSNQWTRITGTINASSTTALGIDQNLPSGSAIGNNSYGIDVRANSGTGDGSLGTFTAIRGYADCTVAGGSLALRGAIGGQFLSPTNTTAATMNIGSRSVAAAAPVNIAALDVAQDSNTASSKNFGVFGLAFNSGSSSNSTAGYFKLDVQGSFTTTASIPAVSGALIADNGSTTSRIIGGYDNGVLAFEVADGGAVTLGAASTTPQHALNTATGTNGADALTLLNGVTGTAGNPTGYIKITVNGSANHYIPYW